MKFIKEFKEFAVKGNMLDMAVAIIIGTGFNKIVSSLVNDVIMPLLSVLIGNVKLEELTLTLRTTKIISTNGAETTQTIALKYGVFMQSIIDFLIIALTVFIVVKAYNIFKKKAENELDKTVTTPKDIALLAEIRDLIKNNKGQL